MGTYNDVSASVAYERYTNAVITLLGTNELLVRLSRYADTIVTVGNIYAYVVPNVTDTHVLLPLHAYGASVDFNSVSQTAATDSEDHVSGPGLATTASIAALQQALQHYSKHCIVSWATGNGEYRRAYYEMYPRIPNQKQMWNDLCESLCNGLWNARRRIGWI
ncbi:hypothetical protein LSAT2_022985 [Lamellibrachia satsuma]|nr:hypothetical protein LSAT2_022985 [Lamellibrachia satsuma]